MTHALAEQSLPDHKWTIMPPTRDRSPNARFGQMVCVSSDSKRMVIGANGYNDFMGLAYVYDLVTGSGDRAQHWRRTKLIASDARSAEVKPAGELRVADRGSGFGFSCAMDAKGDTILIGAPGHDVQRGTVYIFSRSAEKRKWVERARLDGPERRIGDFFGWAISSSHDGKVVAISAKGRRASNGEVYMYSCPESGLFLCQLVQQILPPDYTDETGPRGIRIRNNFGISMAMSGDGKVLVVGSTGYKTERGAAYVLEQNSDGGQWLLSHRIASSAPEPHAFFGFKLAMDYSGEILAVGADGEDKYRGSVYLYERRLGQNEQSLTNCGIKVFGEASHFGCPTRLEAPERASEDNYGGSLALSGDGKVLAVGSPGKKSNEESDHGAVYLYQKSCAQNASILSEWVPAGIDFLGVPHSQSGSYYAWALALTSGGNRIVVTAPEAYQGCGVVAVRKVSKLRDPSKVGHVLSFSARLIKYISRGRASFLEGHDDL
jgi:hypothetical protein